MAVDWFEPICAYCERQGPGFSAEPANALSNGAFLVAASASAWQARGCRPPDVPCLALAILVAVVGTGSFLFHTQAVFWAMLADVIPIALFIDAYLFLALRRFLGLAPAAAAAVTVVFAAMNLGLGPGLDAAGLDAARRTGGSIDYLPALLALAAVALAVMARPDAVSRSTGRRLAAVGALFLVSLCLRTLDGPACAMLPIGTHAAWHVLNAAVLYALIATALRHRRIAARAA